MKRLNYLIGAIFLVVATSSYADMTVPISLTDGEKSIGTVNVTETKYGLLFSPHVQGLKPGVHGFHVHVNPSCADKGMAAGGHFDPKNTGKHLGPYNDNGHLGDLPALYVDADGNITLPVLAPRFKRISQIKNHALMIHEGGDNYSDEPKLGGGGARMGCGVVK